MADASKHLENFCSCRHMNVPLEQLFNDGINEGLRVRRSSETEKVYVSSPSGGPSGALCVIMLTKNEVVETIEYIGMDGTDSRFFLDNDKCADKKL